MKKTLLLLVPLLLLSSCKKEENTSSSSDSNEIVVTDLINREVKVNKSAKDRVICIGAGALRLYSYVGEINNIVGVEDIDRDVNANVFKDVSRPYYDINKDYFKTLPSIGKGGPQAQQAEVEKIISVNPKLIISEYNDVNKANDLQSKTGVPVLVVGYGKESVFDKKVTDSINLLGKVLNKEEKATSLNNYILDCKNELKNNARKSKDEKKSKLYIGCLGNWGQQDIFSTSSSFPLFDVNDVEYALDETVKLTNGKIEEEKFYSLKIDKLILDSAGLLKFKETYTNKKANFENMDVFKNNEIYLEMPFNAYYTNLEIALMDSYFISSVSYPSLYTDDDLIKKYNEISKNFLGVEYYDSIKSAKLSYGGFQKIDNFDEFIKNV